MIGLYHHGSVEILKGVILCVVSGFVEEVIATYCQPEDKKSSFHIPIKDIRYLPLCIIMFTITQVAGSSVPHWASRAHIQYSIECTKPCVFG